MQIGTIALVIASLLLAGTSGFYGIRFLRRGDYLLGPEWLVVAFSATNAAIYAATGLAAPGIISHFCDAFSRGFGMPVIAVAGLMAVTNGYKLSIGTDVVLFAASFMGAVVLVAAPGLGKVLPYYYVVMWSLYSAFLLYFALKLHRGGETGHAVATLVTIASSQFVASIYDFTTFPGDAPGTPLNFYILAEPVWAFSTVQLYYAYCALARARGEAPDRTEGRRLSARPV